MQVLARAEDQHDFAGCAGASRSVDRLTSKRQGLLLLNLSPAVRRSSNLQGLCVGLMTAARAAWLVPGAGGSVAAPRPRIAGPAQACFLRHVPSQQQHRQQQLSQAQQPLPQQARHRPRCTRLHAAADEAGPAPTSSSDLGVQQAAGGLQARLAALGAFLDALYRFSRPHTMLGTAVSVTSVSALALGPGQLGAPALLAFAQAIVAALLMNISILYDIEIDRINKPYLPLAAGDFSVPTGWALVVATGAASLAIGAASGSLPLLATLGGSLLLGLAYSTDLPLLRWKRSPVLAAACILAVRAVLVQLGFFFHMQLALGSAAPAITRPIAFATAFMLLFSVVIALFKDIPDVAGDSKAGVRTLSVRLGPPRVFWACIAILEAAYVGAILVGLQSDLLWSRVATTVAHLALGALLLWRARQTDLTSPKEISRCYMFTWGLFYAEYLLFPLLR
ncbi:hypothetical protein COHA_003303 [Chlorella ohadii]|uniref:Uncharacterized protein n=1 Tax=Chlorella ohadii TaxID=2649997 RepID=A0AAD5DT08_9CHLO|nr:hypothetical protein COHA_003303 [Chlorella ohadii]